MIYTEKTREAAVLAHKAHILQVDKSGFPYFLHLLLVADQAQTEDECVVALLHDICEDVSMEYLSEIREKFGDTIADAVDAITKRKGQETYFEYIDRCKMNPLAARVKLYDLHHNMTPQRTQMLPPDQRGLVKRFEKSRRIVTEALRERHHLASDAQQVPGAITDELYDSIVQCVCSMSQVSVAGLQRRFRIGFGRTVEILDRMEAQGIISPADERHTHKVLVEKSHRIVTETLKQNDKQ